MTEPITFLIEIFFIENVTFSHDQDSNKTTFAVVSLSLTAQD